MILLSVPLTFLFGYCIGRETERGRDESAEAVATEVSVECRRDTLTARMPEWKESRVTGKRVYAYAEGGGISQKTEAGSSPSLRSGHNGTEELPVEGNYPSLRSGHNGTVELPEVQRHYRDSTYEAWVSGPVDPRLDSVRIFARTTIVRERVWKPPKRWHIGVTAGYGWNGKSLTPFVGVGVSYSIISF